MTTRVVALYARLSPRPDGSYEGVPVQIAAGQEYAAKAWPGVPVEVFADRGIDASRDDTIRPDFERFRQWLADGRIAHVWARAQVRLERREVPWFTLAAELDAAGIPELHTDHDGIVQVRSAIAGIKAVLAAEEIRVLKKRVNDRLAANAAKGEPAGTRPFGYVHTRNEEGARTYEIVPEQADAIRWAADRVLDGWALENVARSLRERGLIGAHGGRIGGPTVRAFLESPTIAGKRVHRGRIVGPGNWPAILDEDTWQSVRIRLSQPRRVQRTDGIAYPVGASHIGNPSGRKFELTGGLAVCGVCGAPLVGQGKQLRNKQGVRTVPYLLCSPVRGGKSCVGVMLEPTEAHVADRLFAELDKPAFRRALATDDHVDRRKAIVGELEAVERQRDELAALWATPGELTTTEWQAARRSLGEREQGLRAELATLPAPLGGIDLEHVRDAWQDMTLDERRELLRTFIERVVVNRARPGAQRFDPARIVIEWRER